MMAESPTCIKIFANSNLLYTSSKMLWITYSKLRLGTSRHAISSLFFVFIFNYYLLWCSSLILLSADIKTNPGLIFISGHCFSICHWNLTALQLIIMLNYIFLLLTVHSFDINCLSETYLNSEPPPNDTRLELPGYNLFNIIYLFVPF